MLTTGRALLISIFAAGLASATTIQYDLTCVDDGVCGGPSYGNVVLSQTDPMHVLVTATLNSGNFFTDNGAHNSLTFNIDGSPAINVASLLPSVFFYPAGTNNPPFGTFEYGIGGDQIMLNGHCCDTLSFTVSRQDGVDLSIDDFSSNAGGYFFAADIFSDGSTFAVAANDSGGGGIIQDISPEPWTFLLAGTGLVLIGLRRRIQR